MNTNKELEQIVRTWLEDRAAEPSRSGMDAALDQVAMTPQQRHRWLGRWFGRGTGATRSAGDHGTPSDSDSGRNRLMYSITTVAASVAALALAATLVVPRGDPGAGVVPGAPAGATHVVAADGTGDFSTIGEAVATASDGDTVLVKPGEYVEALVIDKDITIQGDGPREDIVLSFPEGGPTVILDPGSYVVAFPLYLQAESDATVRSLTILAPAQGGAILAGLGAPVLEDLVILIDPEAYLAIALGDVSGLVLRDSSIEGGIVTAPGGSTLTMEGNTFRGGESAFVGEGEVVARDNEFLDGAGLSFSDGMTGNVESNSFSGAQGDTAAAAVSVTDSDVVIRANSFTERPIAIGISAMSSASIEDNELVDNGIGISWSSTQPGTIDSNTIRGGQAGLVLSSGSPVVTGNIVADAAFRGIAMGRTASPSLDGNTVCGSTTNLWVDERAEPEMGDNDICPDAAAE